MRPTPLTARHPEVYEPAEDSFLFLDALEKEVDFLRKLQPCIIIEIGPGSGIVGAFFVQLLESPSILISIDVNADAASTTRETYRLNDLKSAETAVAYLFSSVRREQVADVILFNPPYVETPEYNVCQHGIEAAWAGGKDGLEVIIPFLQELPSRLSPTGIAYLLVEKRNQTEQFDAVLRNANLSCVTVHSARRRNEFLSLLGLRHNGDV